MSEREEIALKPQTYAHAVEALGRVGAFAPGNYLATCMACGTHFEGDKRAFNCLPCAIGVLRLKADAILARDEGRRGVVGRPVAITNEQLDPFEEIGQALYDEAYRNGFADANYDGEEYDLDRQLEGLDRELMRDGWYEGNKGDFLQNVTSALAAAPSPPVAVAQTYSTSGDEREEIARIIALAGLGTTDGSRRGMPENWGDEALWGARILECIPTEAAERCFELAAIIQAARAQGLGPGEAVAREDIERVIAEADRRLAYSMSLVRLVDGDHTYRLSIDGETLLFTDSETPDWNAHDRLLAHIAECKGRVRADAILELFSKPLAATPTREA